MVDPYIHNVLEFKQQSLLLFFYIKNISIIKVLCVSWETANGWWCQVRDGQTLEIHAQMCLGNTGQTPAAQCQAMPGDTLSPLQ